MAFKLLPANLVAYGRFMLGNKITDMLGVDVASQTDMNLSLLDENAKDVLREAVANARKAGRNYVEYKDYPVMASGERPENFYKGMREKRGDLDLVFESMTDPVLEMFTSVGGFVFEDSPDGGFIIPNDPYDFDRAKSPKSRKAKDDYSKAVYGAQDLPQTYRFSLSGTIPPKGGNQFDTEYLGKMVTAAYDTASDVLMTYGNLAKDALPLEFIATAREAIDRYADSLSVKPTEVDLAEVNFPNMEALPDWVGDMVGTFVPDGIELTSKYDDGFNLDLKLPRIDRTFGDILDVDIDMSVPRPRLPAAFLSDERLTQVKDAVTQAFDAMTPPKGDELTFGQAFARNRALGREDFEWRGNKYHTRYKEEMNGQEA
jgi:hypothetical protein